VAAWILIVLCQDDAAKAKELLRAVAAAAKDSAVVAFEAEASWKGWDVRQKLRVRLKRPNLARVESVTNDVDAVYVLDGRSFWHYLKATHDYVTGPQTDGHLDLLGAGPVPALLLRGATNALEAASKIKVSRERLGGEDLDVVAWTEEQSECALWIDARKIVRRYDIKIRLEDDTVEQSIDFSNFDFAAKAPDDAFTFTPPKDAKESKPAAAPLLEAGSAAPAFEAADPDGKPVKLADFKEKPVLLFFWYRDCLEARAAFPALQKWSEEFKDVVFLAVNRGDSAEDVKKVLADEKIAIRALLQKEGEINKTYRVSVHPTVYLVASDGRIAFASAGFDREKIRAALAKASPGK
jgi:outer membrane lipoprotein-sorting protein/peroxiredoxin